jgi:hypothetical protein
MSIKYDPLLGRLRTTDIETAASIGLGNVDNTSDANKPVSIAQQAALDLKANDNAVVKLAGNQTVSDVKSFTGATNMLRAVFSDSAPIRMQNNTTQARIVAGVGFAFQVDGIGGSAIVLEGRDVGGVDAGGSLSLYAMTGKDMIFRHTTKNGGTTDRMRMLSNGYFGINTITPHSRLHVDGSFATAFRAITAARTLDASDHIISADGTFNITLPTAVDIVGRQYKIKNIGTGTITVVTTSSQTIDGAANHELSAQYQSVTVVSDGTNWLIL